MRILINTLLFLFISTAAWAVSPAIFYSDLTSGPNTGGQNNAGVFVTVWGNSFGSTQGSSTVKVGGGVVANIQTWTNTMICFQLGSAAVTGNIVVTTSGGTSNGIPFTVRSGNIYFVQPAAANNGTGTYTSPFNRLYYAYSILVPGDTVYVMAGTIYDEEDGYTGWHSIITTQNAGTQADPIAYVAYPNATVILQADGATSTWTAGSSGGNDPVDYIFRDDGGSWTTISKFTMELTGTGANTEVEAGTDTGWRVVGNTLTANAYIYAQIDFAGPNTEVIGNTIYNSGAGQQSSNEDHSIYLDGASNQFEIGWNYLYGNQNSGWEISCFHQGQRNGSIHDNLIIAKSAGSVKGILLGDVDTGETQSTEWGSTYKVYNNIIVNAGQADNGGAMQLVDGTGYIYNNTIYYSGTETKGIIQVPTNGVGPNGGDPVWYFADNIIVANNAGLYISDENGNAPNWSFFALLADNNYYGQGNGPTNDSSAINANPQFVSPGTTTGNNFQLQVTSPDINAGYNTTVIVAKDFSGLVRGSAPSIGAYEYSGSITPSLPVVAITSPSTGSSVTAGTNVIITANASETNGTIANVYLYNGLTLVGSDSTSPYTYNWTTTNLVAGNYILTAVATDTNGVSTTSSPITVTVTAQSGPPSPAVVTVTSPINGSSYIAGSNVPVTVTASEVNGSIRYIYLYTGLGIFLGSSPVYATSGSFTYTDTNMTSGGYSFFAIATDGNGVATQSSTVSIMITSSATAPTITTQPLSVTVNAPTTATFYVTATGTPTPSYQWKQEASGVSSYSSISGATSASYTTAATTTSNSGTKYECVVTNSAGSATSGAATLTVTAASAAPSITTQPSSVSVTAPATATFNVVASGTPSPTYQWQQEASGASTFTVISGATSSSYTTGATTTSNSGTKYECVVTNSAGSVTSNVATLTINAASAAPSITSQPANVTVSAPATATFSVAATGTPAPSYQWMQSVGGGSYTAISGATSTSYTTAATTTANSGTKYECVVTNTAGSATSNAATLTVNGLPVIAITSPSTGSSVTAGSNVSITASASEVNGTIANVAFYNGSTLLGSDSTSPYTYVMTNPAAGSYTLTAVATDANGVSTTSSSITVTVTAQPVTPPSGAVVIISPSNGSTYTAGSNIPVTVTASETNGSIRYIYLYTGSGVFLGSSAVFAATGSFTYTNSNMTPGNYSFYAIATDVNGVPTQSSTVTITIAPPSPPVVAITSPTNKSYVKAGSNLTITASPSEANGNIATVFFYNGSTLLGSDSTSPYTITLSNVSAGTYVLTAMATDTTDNSTTSNPVTIKVH